MSGEGQEEALERDLAEILVNHKCPCGHYFGRHHIDTGCTDMDGNFEDCYCPLNMPEAEAAAIVASDWLARRESEAAEKALRDAADEWTVGSRLERWLRARADSVAQGREETP